MEELNLHEAQATKTCTKCGQTKDKAEFSRDRRRKDGRRSLCKSCNSAYYERNKEWHRTYCKRWYEANKERYSAGCKRWREAHRFQEALGHSQAAAKRFGHIFCTATPEELEAAFAGKCAICGVPEAECSRKLALDHDHITGEFRGWLCASCNSMLGYSVDSPERLEAAAAYLRKHKASE